MLDLHAVSSGGGTTITGIGTILLGGDGATVAGVPIRDNARLIGWGGMTTIADTLNRLRLLALDQIDPQNGEDIILGGSSVIGALHVDTNIFPTRAQRVISMIQNTAGANNMGYTMDQYPPVVPRVTPPAQTTPQGSIKLTIAAGAALTAITWGATAFTPTSSQSALKSGTYAILGAWVNALTNYGLIRFTHADFAGLKPGFPVVDAYNPSLARANTIPNARIWNRDGYQFALLKDIPVFRVTQQGTGLNFELASITADTPRVTLNLVKVA